MFMLNYITQNDRKKEQTLHLKLGPIFKVGPNLVLNRRYSSCDIYGNGKMSHRSVCRWAAEFKIGYKHPKDVARTDCPATVTTNNNTVKTHQILQNLARCTMRQLARITILSLARVHCIFKKESEAKN